MKNCWIGIKQQSLTHFIHCHYWVYKFINCLLLLYLKSKWAQDENQVTDYRSRWLIFFFFFFFQIAQHQGYIKINYKEVQADIERTRGRITREANRHYPGLVENVSFIIINRKAYRYYPRLPVKLWIWTPFMARCIRYNIMW